MDLRGSASVEYVKDRSTAHCAVLRSLCMGDKKDIFRSFDMDWNPHDVLFKSSIIASFKQLFIPDIEGICIKTVFLFFFNIW